MRRLFVGIASGMVADASAFSPPPRRPPLRASLLLCSPSVKLQPLFPAPNWEDPLPAFLPTFALTTAGLQEYHYKYICFNYDTFGIPMPTALQRGLLILESLARAGRPLSFGEINARLGTISRATLSRLIRDLAGAGYVQKDPATGLYGCGHRLAVFSQVCTQGRREHLLGLYMPLMEEISERFRVTTVLTERVQDTFVGIHRVQLQDTVKMQEVGHINDQPDQPWMQVLVAFDDRVRAEPRLSGMLRSVATIRARGYAYADEKRLGFRRLVFPLFETAGNIIGALGLGGTPLQITDKNRDRIAQQVQKSLRSVSVAGGEAR